MDAFQLNVKNNRDRAYAGYREKDAEGNFGPYVWKTYGEIDEISSNLARGIKHLDLAPDVDGEGKKWRFLGLWAKNRWEWQTTLLAAIHYNITSVGFYDAMGSEALDFIFNQTEMSTIFVASYLIPKIIALKKEGKAAFIQNLVAYDEISSEITTQAGEVDITLYTFDQVIQEGEKNKGTVAAFIPAHEDDIYTFSYTSGTTGDAKGVKLSHKNILASSQSALTRLTMDNTDLYISYLPYPHSFEQCLLVMSLLTGCKVGYY